jgi:intracellular sulfur oxidation DsrE/DsrF family protein
MAYLAVVDRVYRGSAEAQFFDALYGVLVLGEQLGGVDVVLRGTAVTAALVPPVEAPRLRVGSLDVPAPDSRASVAEMLARGVTVYVDEPSVRAFGLGPDAVLPGARLVDTGELAGRWSDHDGVWFL